MDFRLVHFFFPVIFRLQKCVLNLVRQNRKRLQRFVHRHLFLHTGKIRLARLPLFPALHLHTLQLPQADTQRTVLLFQLFQFFFRRTDTLPQGHLFRPLETHISRTLPVIQQRLVALVVIRLYPFRQCLKHLSSLLQIMCQLLFVGHPFPKVLLLLQLCAKRGSLFCHLALFRLERGQFLVSQQHNATRLRLQFLQLRLLFGLHHVDFPTDARINFRARKFLQDIRFFLLLAFQELGKLSLCQQRSPAELLKGETDTPLYLRTCFGRLIRKRSPVLQGKCPDHFLNFPSSLVARPCHAPHGP